MLPDRIEERIFGRVGSGHLLYAEMTAVWLPRWWEWLERRRGYWHDVGPIFGQPVMIQRGRDQAVICARFADRQAFIEAYTAYKRVHGEMTRVQRASSNLL